MAAYNFGYSEWFSTNIYSFEPIAQPHIFISQLAIGTTTLGVALWTRFKGRKLSLCRNCMIRFGNPAERGFLGRMFSQEGRFQNDSLIVLSLLGACMAWGYNLLTFISEDIVTTNEYIYAGFTIAIFLIAEAYITIRYIGVWSYYCHKEEVIALNSITMTNLRYIVIWDNYIALKRFESDPDGELSDRPFFDTPITFGLAFRHNVTQNDAEKYFKTKTNIDGVDIRFMYSTIGSNADCNIFHYLCFVNDEQKVKIEASNPDVQWFSIAKLLSYVKHEQADTLLCAEVNRMLNIYMASKAYNSDGTRRYSIKHYSPIFRLRNIKAVDIDFGSPKWLYIADNNEDKPLFRIRRFWRKYINAMTE